MASALEYKMSSVSNVIGRGEGGKERKGMGWEMFFSFSVA